MSASDKTSGNRPLRDGIDTVRSQVHDVAASANDAAHAALDRAHDGLDLARDTAADLYETGREKAADGYAAARERALAVTGNASETLEASPLIAVAGGLALGALIGALLPRTDREAQMYGTLGNRLAGAARDAVDAARQAGRETLAQNGVSRDHARESVRGILDAALSAASNAGDAAIEAARQHGGVGKA